MTSIMTSNQNLISQQLSCLFPRNDTHLTTPLSVPWVAYFDSPARGMKMADFSKTLKQEGSFRDLVHFSNILERLDRNRLVPETNLRIFRQGVGPLWEDPANRRGGKFVVILKEDIKEGHVVPEPLFAKFLLLIVSLVCGVLGFKDSLNGVVLSVRSYGVMLTLWNSEARDRKQINAIKRKLKSILRIANVKYQDHKTTMRFNRRNHSHTTRRGRAGHKSTPRPISPPRGGKAGCLRGESVVQRAPKHDAEHCISEAIAKDLKIDVEQVDSHFSSPSISPPRSRLFEKHGDDERSIETCSSSSLSLETISSESLSGEVDSVEEEDDHNAIEQPHQLNVTSSQEERKELMEVEKTSTTCSTRTSSPVRVISSPKSIPPVTSPAPVEISRRGENNGHATKLLAMVSLYLVFQLILIYALV